MRLSEALEILNAARTSQAPVFRAILACGFTPLHLATFFAAHLQARFPDRRVSVASGLYGDLIGNITRLESEDAAAVVVEWLDLDPRLGYRRLGGWRPSQLGEIVQGCEAALADLETALERAAGRVPLAVAFPALPLPPAFMPPNCRASAEALRLRAAVSFCAERLAGRRGVAVTNPEELDRQSPLAGRFDLKSDLLTGFPYANQHAEVLARLLAAAVPGGIPQKKGLITDLDDTLWQGILGEAGVDGLSWDLDHHSQIHGLYQQVLAGLAEQGVLIAAASKNDSALVEQAFTTRHDLLISPGSIFPREAGWGPKSESVGRILRRWNIGPESAVFIDDSPLEVAEVRAAFQSMQCLQYPKGDYDAVLALLRQLRDLFGKDAVEAEDALRLDSIRRGGDFEQASTSAAGRQEEFLAGLEARLSFTVNPPASESRVLELVNKTNQFNLNGERYGEAEWSRLQAEPGALTVAVAYQDKFGPLGTIAVMHGARGGRTLHLRTWVMSCRAFSRRIEHRCLEFLFDHLGVDQVHLKFRATERNGPLREFLAALLGHEPEEDFGFSRADCAGRLPALHHAVEIKSSEVYANG